MRGDCKSAWIVGFAWNSDPTVTSTLVFFAETANEAREAGEADSDEHAVVSMERAPWLDGVSWGRDAKGVIQGKAKAA